MAARPVVLVLAGALLSLGASYRTQNFVVTAPTQEIAEQIGRAAEHYRQEKAMLWLGREMPPWPEPCPLSVKVTDKGSGGATTFGFDHGQVSWQKMEIQGSLDRLVASVLPHEVTHTVFAYYFKTPVPRWADEGGAVLSEDEQERNHHDRLVRDFLNRPGHSIPLNRLFRLTQYPPEVMVLYAEGFSVTDFLVGQSSRPVFLRFLAQGMQGDWDAAVRTHYRYKNVDDLEQAWLQHLRDTRLGQQGAQGQLASKGGGGPVEADPARRVVERRTAPPAQPLLDIPKPIYRGKSDDEGWDVRPASQTASPQESPRPAPPPPQVKLNAPLFEAPPTPPKLGQPVLPSNPVGYPRP
jgi:hypothetical protein